MFYYLIGIWTNKDHFLSGFRIDVKNILYDRFSKWISYNDSAFNILTISVALFVLLNSLYLAYF